MAQPPLPFHRLASFDPPDEDPGLRETDTCECSETECCQICMTRDDYVLLTDEEGR